MTFRITTLLYLFALLAVSLAAFGAAGVIVCVGVLTFWLVAFSLTPPTRLELAVICVIALILAALLMPAASGTRVWQHHAACRNNLRQLALAILNFESAKNELPTSTFVYGANNDTHSWRLRVLHYIEAQNSLYIYSLVLQR